MKQVYTLWSIHFENIRTWICRILVEQLARVDPSNLKHEEKLAFWINLYNALLMHVSFIVLG
jgi:hypothetical protein